MNLVKWKLSLPVEISLGLLVLTCVTVAEWEGDVVFEDNFDGTTLDLNKWEYQEGCGNEYGGGNLQCYVRNNVAVQNGNLVITAKKENMQDKEYTSGRIRQKGNGFVYGAYVTRARLARGDHLWPALWLLPIDNYCRYEEIDIAEYRGQPSQARNLEMAAHWGKSWDMLTSKGKLTTAPFDLSAAYHEFAVLWLPSKIEWYIDNVKYYEVSLTDGTFNGDSNKWPCKGEPTPFIQPSNFIFNIAVGGGFFEGYPPLNPSTWTKPSMEIDWVRVYQA